MRISANAPELRKRKCNQSIGWVASQMQISIAKQINKLCRTAPKSEVVFERVSEENENA